MRIYVGNLNYRTTEADLRDFYGQYGEVDEVAIIVDRQSGRSRGYGFVVMPDDEEAEHAISQTDQAEFAGRLLTVNPARPRGSGTGRAAG